MEATCEGVSEKEALLDCWDKSWIQSFGNAYDIRVIAKYDSVTHQAKLPERPEGMKKDRIALGKLGQMVRPNSIWLDSLT